MCCGYAFWKRLIAFGLAFWVGVLVSSLFSFDLFTTRACPASKKQLPPAVRTFENRSVTETKKCVPIDANLHYERLTAEEKNEPESQKSADAKKSLKESKDKQKKSFKPEKPLFESSKDSAEIKDALHREKCFETQERK